MTEPDVIIVVQQGFVQEVLSKTCTSSLVIDMDALSEGAYVDVIKAHDTVINSLSNIKLDPPAMTLSDLELVEAIALLDSGEYDPYDVVDDAISVLRTNGYKGI